MAKDKGKQKVTGSGDISFPGLEKKMAPKARLNKSKSKKIDTINKNKRIKELCTIIFGDVEPNSQLHKPNTKIPFVDCDLENIKHLSDDHKECYKLVSDWFQPIQNLRHVDNLELEEIHEYHKFHFPEESIQSLPGIRLKWARFFHIIAVLNEMEENAAAAAAEGITVQEFTDRAVVVHFNNAAAQCKFRAAEFLAAEAQFRALASQYEHFNDIDDGASRISMEVTKQYWASLVSSLKLIWCMVAGLKCSPRMVQHNSYLDAQDESCCNGVAMAFSLDYRE
ncbi:hypothetical protein BTUL_0185g00180 [Botrytis tulipae]|uniref:Uncharacterized protein n=1 Tax=Botrytis tulipae TaxID=87230 RepID=A0A4Z1EBX3_9HELO|nr:hypothetical protein BTUL_0185g00180 [Botrytis tulipae]